MLDTIAPDSVEELSQVVAPWQLTLRQLSQNKLKARVGCTPVNDILVTNERWQAHVQGLGATPAGYFTIVGNSAGFPVFWKGQALADNTLACAPGNTECEFHTPHGANHWVMLIPQQKLADHMGVEVPGIPCPKSHLLRGNLRRRKRGHRGRLLNRGRICTEGREDGGGQVCRSPLPSTASSPGSHSDNIAVDCWHAANH